MAEILLFDANDEPLFGYRADVIPRKGEFLTILNDEKTYKVINIEHFIRPYGDTLQMVSPHVSVTVDIKL